MQNVVNLNISTADYLSEEFQVVAFKLGQEEYGADVLNVQEINRPLNITRVPRTQEYIEGVVNLRGNIVPVINLHTKFNIKGQGSEDDKRIIVFQFDDLKVGIIVDEVSEVIRLKTSDIEETAKVYNAMTVEHIKGIAKVNSRLLILLDLPKILEV